MSTSEAPPRLTLGPDDHGRPVSADEFADADYAAPWKYEREDGRLVVMPPDGKDHIVTSSPWLDRLIVYKLNHPEVVWQVVPNAWIRVSDGTDRIGDLGVYLVETEIPDRPPAMMFEVVSPGKVSRERDYIKKRAEYHKLGVREYVIVDRFQETVTVLTYAVEGYQERVLTAADTYTSPLLPGLAVPLAEVLGR